MLNFALSKHYDPVAGRFLSIDPVTFMDTGNPGCFNRYEYAWNDPINVTDPDGRCNVTANLGCENGRDMETVLNENTITGNQALMVLGAAIVAFDVLTLPSGEGAAGVAIITTARGAAVDAGVGVTTDATLNLIDQVVQADCDLSQTDFAEAASATLENAPESALGGIIGGSAGRKLDGTISPLKGDPDQLTGDAMTDAFIGVVKTIQQHF